MFGRWNGDTIVLTQVGEIANACWIEIPKHFPNVTLDHYIIMPDHIHGIIIISGPPDDRIIMADGNHDENTVFNKNSDADKNDDYGQNGIDNKNGMGGKNIVGGGNVVRDGNFVGDENNNRGGDFIGGKNIVGGGNIARRGNIVGVQNFEPLQYFKPRQYSTPTQYFDYPQQQPTQRERQLQLPSQCQQPKNVPKNHCHAFQKMTPNSIGSIIRAYKSAVTLWCKRNRHPQFRWQRNFYERIIRNEQELNRVRLYIQNNPQRKIQKRNTKSTVTAYKENRND